MANKGQQGNFFEDFALGQVVKCPTPRTITVGDISNYIAYTGDRTPRFCGPAQLIHPLVTFHAAFGQTVRTISLNAVANLGYAGVKWLAPVRIGDTLYVELEIVGLKENSSQTSGIVYVANRVTNQYGIEVMSFYRWVMVRKRDNAPTAYKDNPIIPELPKYITPEELQVYAVPLPTRVETGGQFAWEDYEENERILHYDGITVNHSDHMCFTRLFQNSAKVHFNTMATNGKPLVYGGVPISFGYALSFNGLENRLGICGLNGGTHANPVHTGDTLYAMTDVLEKAEPNHPDIGALRLRLLCIKNDDPSKLADPATYLIKHEDPKKPGRRKHNEHIVLDLDYWELVPKQSALQ
jgi:2-methylfumaryl-CoA hydratase